MATHTMKLAAEPFTAIKNGQKTIESRLYDKKRQAIQPGDTIVFSLSTGSTQKLTAIVVGLLRYETFEALFQHNDPHKFGEPTVKELLYQIAEFYSTEDQKQNGVVGIEFRLV